MPDLIAWAHGEGHEVTLIEVMPLGRSMATGSTSICR